MRQGTAWSRRTCVAAASPRPILARITRAVPSPRASAAWCCRPRISSAPPVAAYGGGGADGRLTLRERFIQVMRGTSKLGSQESHSGVPNPQADGPPLPEYLMDNRTLSWQIGQDKTTMEDNAGPFAVTATEEQLAGVPQLTRV